MKALASDNYSGVHPEVMEALRAANAGYAISYGADDYTSRAVDKFKSFFGDGIEAFLVYNGTGANILGLTATTKSFNSIICAEGAHINVDESTAPEKFLGCKLLTLPAADGKITAAQVQERIQRVGDQHHPQVKVVSISQASEYGTVYTPAEIKAISQVTKANGLLLHMDGSRISNAAVTLGQSLRSVSRDAGVDVLSFGGTKNGMMFGEAVIFFNPGLAGDFLYLRKQAMQLHSKMRFIAAQFEVMLSNDLWKRNATHTNRMATLLGKALKEIPGITITQKIEANGVFAVMPMNIIEPLQQDYPFYVWNEKLNEVRLMCSWDTTEGEIGQFVTRVRALMANIA